MLGDYFSSNCACKKHPFEVHDFARCLFCGGSHCKRCGPLAYTSLESPAFEKLHSSWITDSILAMQRPSESMLVEGNLLEQFRRHRISAIFNLTEPGEHQHCGHGNLDISGFPYNPDTVMASGIKYFNYSWRDMKVPPISLVLDIVHVAYNEICGGGKIAVHCHAGFGRTGIIVACVLIAGDGFSAEESISVVRQRRPGSIQTLAQENSVIEFEKAYRSLTEVYPNLCSNSNIFDSTVERKSITQSVRDQFYSLPLDELGKQQLKYTSKVVSLISSELIDYLESTSINNNTNTNTTNIDNNNSNNNNSHGQDFRELLCSAFAGISKVPTPETAVMISTSETSDTLNPAPTVPHNPNPNLNLLIPNLTPFPIDIKKLPPTIQVKSSYKTFESKIPAEFINKLFNEINYNNWATVLQLVDILRREDVDEAVVIGLLPSPLPSSLSSSSPDLPCTYSRKEGMLSAARALAHLLISWLDSREDAVLDEPVLDKLDSVWHATEDAHGISPMHMHPGMGAAGNGHKFGPQFLKMKSLISIASTNADSIFNDDLSRSGSTGGPNGGNDNASSGGDEEIKDISYRYLKSNLESSMNKIKLYHISAIVRLLQIIRNKTPPVTTETSEEIEEPKSEDLGLLELMIVRLSIALTLSDRKCPELLTNRDLSLDFIRFLQTNVVWSRSKSIRRYKLSAGNFCSASILLKVMIAWNSLECLVKQGWKYDRQSMYKFKSFQTYPTASNPSSPTAAGTGTLALARSASHLSSTSATVL